MASLGVALVTGAGQGIGRAIALRLAADGYDLALADLASHSSQLDTLKAQITGLGRRATTISTDVQSESAVVAMINQTVQDLGTLDVMVANAGICKTMSLLDTNLSDWEDLFAVNARGTFLCYKYAAKQMVLQGRGGRIIGASSVVGKQGSAMLPAYSASKFAVRGLTQSAAAELARYGITVNAYAPGAMDTDMLTSIHQALGDVNAYTQRAIDNAPLGRLGTGEDVASLVSFLASKDSSYITGQSISVNGGRFFD
ncbi:hypothetical protein HGRIS_000583 [Hohenbuehelia grisea]|uniref:Acetoin reductase family protein n=1 Tax=Hohenbuehelia grisea TaxID=104357 RepID=A0ABR3JST9_9AGAR